MPRHRPSGGRHKCRRSCPHLARTRQSQSGELAVHIVSSTTALSHRCTVAHNRTAQRNLKKVKPCGRYTGPSVTEPNSTGEQFAPCYKAAASLQASESSYDAVLGNGDSLVRCQVRPSADT